MNTNESELTGGSATPQVLKEVIRSPLFKEIMQIYLADIDPQAARDAIKVLLWEDVAFTMGILSTTPQVINAVIEVLLELGEQLQKFTPGLLKSFMSQTSGGIDIDRIRQIPAAYSPLVDSLIWDDPEMRDRISSALVRSANDMLAAGTTIMNRMDGLSNQQYVSAGRAGLDPTAVGEFISAGARLISSSAERNPTFIREVVESIDTNAILAAGFSILRSVLMATVAFVRRLFGSVSGLFS